MGYTFRTTRRDKEVIDADGIPIMKTLFHVPAIKRHGFSNAYHYHQSKVHASTVNNALPNFVSLDLETTGLRPAKDQIISIGAVRSKDGHVDNFYKLVNLEPGHSISTDISRVTKLDSDLLRLKGTDLKDVLIDLKHFVDAMPIVGYNLQFDERFLQVAVITHKLIQFNNKMVDILPVVKKVDPFCDNYHLSTVLDRYNIKNDDPHNALADAKATMLLAKKLIEKQHLHI